MATPTNVSTTIASGATARIGVPAPAPSPSLVLSASGTATVGVAKAVTVTAANIDAAVAVTVARVSGPAATVSPVPVNPAPGDLTKLAYATAAAVGTLRLRASATIGGGTVLSNDLDLVVDAAPSPPPPSPSPADFVDRRTPTGVIAWQGFDADAEVTAFANPRDTDFHSVPLYRESDPVVGSCLVFKFLGASLAADFPASGGNGPRPMVLDDASDWPTTFPFRFFVTRVPLGETGPARKKTLFECTARTGNTLTVTYVPLGISEFDSGASFTDRVIGDAAGSECQNYVRLFSAMTGADNGKGAADPAANGTLPVRSRIPGNPSAPPQGPSMFGYGYCAHPDYVNDARFNPWVPGYQGTGLGDGVSREDIIDTSEIYIQFRAWFDPNTRLPNMTGGKIVGIQTETTTPQQIVMGMGPGGGVFNIPSTPEVPFALAKFSHTSFGSAGRSMLKDPYETSGVTADYSYQPGSFDPATGKSWALTAIAAVSGQPSTGQDTPDGNSAWEHKYGRWVTFLWRIKPGKTWHYSVAIKTAWNSATQDTFTLLDSPDEWPTSSFQIRLDIDGQIFNVASRVGAVFSGVTLVSGSHVNLPAFSSTWVQKYPATPAGAAALSTLLEVKFADFGATEYTTLFSVDNYPILYGSRGQAPNYFDDSIAGFSAMVLWGYRNTDLSSVAPYKVLYQKFAQLIISKDPIAVPLTSAPPPPPAPAGSKPLPVFQNAAEFDNGSDFDSSLGGTFDVGTGPSTGIVARVVSHTGSGGGDITSFVIGGVTLTPLAQEAIAGFNANERLFYGVGLSLTGAQSWLATVGSATRIAVQLFAAHSAVTFDAGVPVVLINNTLAQAVTPDRNSIQVALLTSNLDAGVVTAKSGTMQRVNSPCNFYQSLIFTEDSPSDPSVDALVTGSAFTSSYLGRIVRLQGAVHAAPTWVPPAGELATLTVANGGLANEFRSQCAPYFDPYYFVRTVNTYGSSFKNPYYGDYGAQWFCSGGHGNMNDNSVTIAEYGATQITFKRVCDPTPWFGTGTDTDTKLYNSAASNETFNGTTVMAGMDIISAGPPTIFNYGLSTIDQKPGSSHVYGFGDFIGPEWGGAAHGTHLRIWSPALNRQFQYGAISALAFDFTALDTPPSTNGWRKDSEERLNEAGQGFGSAVSVFVGPQKRAYKITNSRTDVRWYDLASKTYVVGTGIGFDWDLADSPGGEHNTGTAFYVPSRGLIVVLVCRGGVVHVQWMDVTVPQPTLGGTATLSMSLAVNTNWAGATWCHDNNRIILAGITGDATGAYEMEIPTNLASTWPVVRAALGAGQSFPAMDSSGETKRFEYDQRVGAIVYFSSAKRADQGNDEVQVYKPRNT